MIIFFLLCYFAFSFIELKRIDDLSSSQQFRLYRIKLKLVNSNNFSKRFSQPLTCQNSAVLFFCKRFFYEKKSIINDDFYSLLFISSIFWGTHIIVDFCPENSLETRRIRENSISGMRTQMEIIIYIYVLLLVIFYFEVFSEKKQNSFIRSFWWLLYSTDQRIV